MNETKTKDITSNKKSKESVILLSKIIATLIILISISLLLYFLKIYKKESLSDPFLKYDNNAILNKFNKNIKEKSSEKSSKNFVKVILPSNYNATDSESHEEECNYPFIEEQAITCINGLNFSVPTPYRDSGYMNIDIFKAKATEDTSDLISWANQNINSISTPNFKTLENSNSDKREIIKNKEMSTTSMFFTYIIKKHDFIYIVDSNVSSDQNLNLKSAITKKKEKDLDYIVSNLIIN